MMDRLTKPYDPARRSKPTASDVALDYQVAQLGRIAEAMERIATALETLSVRDKIDALLDGVNANPVD